MSDRRSAEILGIAGVTVLAAVLRFPLLDSFPPGLYHDEALNGLDALRVLDGVTPVFFPANNGREPLFIYLIAGAIALLGRSVLAIRVVSAVLGTLTVPATYLMGRQLFNPRIGLLAAIITAISVWPVNLSRVGFRAVAIPLFVALMIWAFWAAYTRATAGFVSRKTAGWFALAGLFAGLLLYTYLAARFVPLVFLAFLVYLAATRRSIPWRGMGILASVALIVATPLLRYFILHQAEAAQRAFQVSILNPEINAGDPVGTLVRHLGRTVLMFNVRGDFIPRHNVPLRPVFDPLLSVFFLLGVGVALRRWRQPACGFVLLWVAGMVWPTVLAEDAPHFLRAVGIVPVVFVLPALGIEEVQHWLTRWKGSSTASGVVGVLLLVSLGWTVDDYFMNHVVSEEAYFQFETAAVELAEEINGFLADSSGRVYLDRRLWDGWAGVRYLVPESPALVLVESADLAGENENASALLAEPSGSDVLLIVWPYAPYEPFLRLLPPFSSIVVREGPQERGDLETEAHLLYVSFEAHPALPQGELAAIFGTGIVLEGGWVSRVETERLYVQLIWRVEETPALDYTATVQLLGPAGLIAQDDHPPTRGWYPMHAWRVGDRIFDDYLLEVPASFDGAGHQVIVALYDPQTLERLPVRDPSGAALGDHFILPLRENLGRLRGSGPRRRPENSRGQWAQRILPPSGSTPQIGGGPFVVTGISSPR